MNNLDDSDRRKAQAASSETLSGFPWAKFFNKAYKVLRDGESGLSLPSIRERIKEIEKSSLATNNPHVKKHLHKVKTLLDSPVNQESEVISPVSNTQDLPANSKTGPAENLGRLPVDQRDTRQPASHLFAATSYTPEKTVDDSLRDIAKETGVITKAYLDFLVLKDGVLDSSFGFRKTQFMSLFKRIESFENFVDTIERTTTIDPAQKSLLYAYRHGLADAKDKICDVKSGLKEFPAVYFDDDDSSDTVSLDQRTVEKYGAWEMELSNIKKTLKRQQLDLSPLLKDGFDLSHFLVEDMVDKVFSVVRRFDGLSQEIYLSPSHDRHAVVKAIQDYVHLHIPRSMSYMKDMFSLDDTLSSELAVNLHRYSPEWKVAKMVLLDVNDDLSISRSEGDDSRKGGWLSQTHIDLYATLFVEKYELYKNTLSKVYVPDEDLLKRPVRDYMAGLYDLRQILGSVFEKLSSLDVSTSVDFS